MMPTAALPTATDLRHALEMIDSAIVSDQLAHEARPLLALVQGAALAGSGDRTQRQALLTALIGGISSLGGDGWRSLTGQPALDLVRRALDEAERMDR